MTTNFGRILRGGLGQASAAFFSLLSAIFYTHVLPVDQYAGYAATLVVLAGAQQLISGPIASCLVRFFRSWFVSRGPKSSMRLVVGAGLLVVCTVAVALAAVHLLSAVLSTQVVSGAASVGALVIGASFSTLVSSCLLSTMNYSAAGTLMLLDQVCRFAVGLGLAALTSSWKACVTGLGVVAMCAGLGGAALLYDSLAKASRTSAADSPAPVPETIRIFTLVRYGAPMMIWGLFGYLHTCSDRIIASQLLTPMDLAALTFCAAVAFQPFVLLGNVIAQLALPWLSKQEAEGSYSSLWDSLRRLTAKRRFPISPRTGLFVAITGAAGLIYCAPWLYGLRYPTVRLLLVFSLLAGVSYCLAQLVALEHLTRRATSLLLIPKISSAVLALGLGIAGAWAGGAVGLSLALCLTQIYYLVTVACSARKIFAASAGSSSRVNFG